MNFILKIIQGPNAGAEVALVSGTTVSFGHAESCDIVLEDQMLPEKAGEFVVEDNQVSLRLPDGSLENLSPLHVKVMETTAFAVGPADAPWGALVWPQPEPVAEVTEPPAETTPPPPATPSEEPVVAGRRFSRRLQWTLLILLLAVVLLEFVIWFFWPQLNDRMLHARIWWQEHSKRWFADKRELAAKPVHRQTLEELAIAFGVEAVVPAEGSNEPPILRGNLRRRADRLRLTALAYNSFPGIELELSDDESFRTSAEELLNMVTEGKVKVAEAGDRRLALAGQLDSTMALRRMLEAIQADVAFVEAVDCSQVTIPEPDVAIALPIVATTPVPQPAEPAKNPEPTVPRMPVVGVLMTPYPCLVMRNGSRVMEGGEFQGFLVDKITEDAVLLRQGGSTLEWKP